MVPNLDVTNYPRINSAMLDDYLMPGVNFAGYYITISYFCDDAILRAKCTIQFGKDALTKYTKHELHNTII